MMNKDPQNSTFKTKFTEFRHSLSYIDALPQLTFLGFLVGLFTGGIIVVFRLIIDAPLFFLLPEHTENFEALSVSARGLFILTGTVALIMLLHFMNSKDREVGVSHVLDRMHNHQSILPLRNWCAQFFGAIICLASGQSVGREGPVVHLGAGAASQFAQWLKLPNNSIHTLAGCGVASAISASFDTPMAGVIFAMEVLAIEYTIVGFVPVILASVMGTMVSKAAFGNADFLVPHDASINSLYEIPVMVLVGLVISGCAGIYIRLNISALKFRHIQLSVRLLVAAGLSILAVIWVPEVMGQGYDTVNSALTGSTALHSLVIIALVKLLLTPIVIGLGVPGGLIGPMLVIGACIGGAIGAVINALAPELGIHPSFYVMMGMAGMMAASLNAPLAALVTVLELSYNPNVIFPAMLVIVVACISTRQFCKVKGIFVEQLSHSNRQLDFGPAKQSLRRAGVRSVMDPRFIISEQITSLSLASSMLANHPMWLIITNQDGHYSHAMRAADLANFLAQEPLEQEDDVENTTDKIDLMEIPGRRYLIGAIHESASLYEAMHNFQQESTEMLYVSGPRTSYSGDIKGILTIDAIENYYKPLEFRKNAVD